MGKLSKAKVDPAAAIRAAVDELGDIKDKIAVLEAREKELVAQLTEPGVAGKVDGLRYIATVSIFTQTRLDQTMVRGFLRPKQLAAASVVTEVKAVRVKPRPGSKLTVV